MSLLSLMAWGGLALFILFTIAWLIQLRTKNAAIVDTIWSLAFPLLAAVYFAMTDGYSYRKWLLLIMVAVWGFRLAGYLFFRTIGKPEDVRYTTLRKEWGSNQNVLMLRFYYFQAIIALALSFPFALIMLNNIPELLFFEIAGAVVWLLAVTGESLADYQLKKFKEDPLNKGKICNQGLWYYSRHPNYFFEWLVWVSFFITALASDWGVLTIICPIVMYYVLTKITGIVYTEREMVKSRGQAFLDYQKSTSAFFPMPKRVPDSV
jgi:steroid 5-alpha reductase family enzyme